MRQVAILAVVTVGLLLQAAWVVWMPPGALPGESAHVGAAARACQRPSPPPGMIPREVAVLREAFRIREGRLSPRDPGAPRLQDAGVRGGQTVFVPGPSAVGAPSYAMVGGMVFRLLAGVDIRWRWVALRTVNAFMVAMAAGVTALAVGRGLPAGVAAAAFVSLGPAAPCGALVGPGALACLLWAVWIMVVLRLGRERWLWAGAVSLALSGASPQGAVACLATVGGIVGTRGGAGAGARVAGLVMGIGGLGLWVYRALTGGLALGGTSWPGLIWGVPGAIQGVPSWVWLSWVPVGCLAGWAVVASLRRGEILPAACALAAAVVWAVVRTESLLPWAPLAGWCLGTRGASLSRVSGWIPLAVGVLFLAHWGFLVGFVLPTFYR